MKYLSVMKTLGVEIGLAKSVISPKGKGLEFAKKTILGGIDVSPIPFKEMSSAHRNLSSLRTFMDKYSLAMLGALRFLGYGYKVDPTKNSKIVAIFDLVASIPRNSSDLQALFMRVTESLLFWKTVYKTDQKETQVIFLNMLVDMWTKLHDQAKSMKWELVGYATATKVSSRGPWQTPQAKINALVVDSVYSHYFSDLEWIIQKSKVELSSLSDYKLPGTAKAVSSDSWLKVAASNWWEVSITADYSKPLVADTSPRIPKRLEDSLFSIFPLINSLDSVQLDNLIKPSPSFPKSPSFVEERRTLEQWDRWSKMFEKFSITTLKPK